MFASQIDVAGLQRDVTRVDATDRLVPGSIEFRVPNDGETGSTMRVGVALSSDVTPAPTCEITTEDGEPVESRLPGVDDELLDLSGRFGDFTPVLVATLEQGRYEASCGAEGEPSTVSGVSFTVGRVFGTEDVSAVFGGLVGSVGGVLVSALMFILGLVLLIVGLVQRQRAKRSTADVGPYGPTGPYTPVPPGGAPPGPPGQYGQPGPYGQPGQYGQPGPYGAARSARSVRPTAVTADSAAVAGPPRPGPASTRRPRGPSPESGERPPPDGGSPGWTVPPSKR